MLPTEDAEWVAAELTRRFGLPLWSFTLTATDANRWAIRLARLVTGRPRCSPSPTATTAASTRPSPCSTPTGVRSRGPATSAHRYRCRRPRVPPSSTTSPSVERALAEGDVAVIVTEPALTNIGIVLPEPGFLDGLRELATSYGALLLIDETHTFSAGPGGCTAAWGLQPDIFVIGKSIGGGIPTGAYGITQAIADRVAAHPDADLIDVGGIGGTLAGNALSTAAMRATLERGPHRRGVRRDDRAVDPVHRRASRRPSTGTTCRGRSASSGRARSTPSPARRRVPAPRLRPSATRSSRSTSTCTRRTAAC